MEIGLVGKYMGLHDAYLSVAEALRHGGFSHEVHVNIHWIDSEEITADNYEEKLPGLDGILVPGGFGSRGIEGMILAAKYARERGLPIFGICLGMQTAVMEYARNMAGILDANSGEFDEQCTHKVIDFMPGQSGDIDKGGTLRLGAYPCVIRPGSTMERCYGETQISERHRHRYEFNNDYRQLLQDKGLVLSGTSPTAGWWRRWNCQTGPSMWACSITRSLRAVPTVRIRFSRGLSGRRWNVLKRGKPGTVIKNKLSQHCVLCLRYACGMTGNLDV